jgi:monoamine oxidase
MAKQLQYSRIMKTAVLYMDRFWGTRRRGGFSVFTNRASDFCFESTYGQHGDKGILCSYATGDKADDLANERSKNNVMRWITEDVVAATRPAANVRIAPIDIAWKAWQHDSCIGGAYAFYRPGQWFTVRPALGERHHRVHFAGEHLSDEWQGFMEGAVETGQRAADAVRKGSRG